MYNKAHLMTGKGKSRIPFDFYPTPISSTMALLNSETFQGSIAEPACGDGSISKVLETYFPNRKIFSSDIQEGIYGIGGVNFLEQNAEYYNFPENIITNPPYYKATEFILHAKQVANRKIAMLLKLNAMAGIHRYKQIWSDKEFPLKKVIILVRRPDFSQKNSPTLEYCWVVWDRYWHNEPIIQWADNRPQDKNNILHLPS